MPSLFSATFVQASVGGTYRPMELIIFGIIFVIIGGAQAVRRRLSWRMSKWQYKNSDALRPSSARLIAVRVGGVIAAVIGLVLIIMGIYHCPRAGERLFHRDGTRRVGDRIRR